ncbi:uncharacterized protein LOC111062033 [Nilaparvata lugens]|uniref:uncharacterized protein LOC111062033 n=1 Tax=Nilaparvata lugens TaxID=108931 RepID=UPI00193DF157|nr:uncharacterized protein LOC111062033 [Nilaparvata lugens]
MSLIPVFAKIMESFQLSAYFEENSLFTEDQFGFHRGRATTDAVQRLVESILEAMEKKHSTAMILCDFTKAFDCVSHEILLGKLMRYGVGGVAMRTMEEYLSRRRQVLTVDGVRSQELQVKYGVL